MNSLYGQASSNSNIFILLFVNNLVIGGAHLDFNLLIMFNVESRKLITTLFIRKLMCPEMVYVVIGVPISYDFQIHFHDLVELPLSILELKHCWGACCACAHKMVNARIFGTLLICLR